MKYNVIYLVLLMSLSGYAFAGVKEACPEPSAIRHTAGVYTATSQVQNTGWLGVVSTGASAPVKSFEAGIFYSGEGKDDTVGKMNKCIYISESGDRVDLNFTHDQTSDLYVRLANIAAWKRMEGAFGIVMYECNDPKKDACSFIVNQ